MSIALITDTFKFPGSPALFTYKEYIEPGMYLHLMEKRYFNFYNTAQKPESLINRVDICCQGMEIVEVCVFYKAIGCKQVKQAFKKLEAEHMHSHKIGWCNLKVLGRQNIQILLRELCNSHDFLQDSKAQMLGMIHKL